MQCQYIKSLNRRWHAAVAYASISINAFSQDTRNHLSTVFLFIFTWSTSVQTRLWHLVLCFFRCALLPVFPGQLGCAPCHKVSVPHRHRVFAFLFCLFLLMSPRRDVSLCPCVDLFVIRLTLAFAFCPVVAQTDGDRM